MRCRPIIHVTGTGEIFNAEVDAVLRRIALGSAVAIQPALFYASCIIVQDLFPNECLFWLWALALREFPRRSLDTVRKTNEILAAALRVVHNWPGGFLGIRHLAVSTLLVFAKALARNVVVQTCVLKVV